MGCTLILDKIDLKHYQRQKRTFYNDVRSIHQKDTTILNINASKKYSSKYMKQPLTELEGENNQFINNSWRLQYPTFNNE